jgi:hypothetical protein
MTSPKTLFSMKWTHLRHLVAATALMLLALPLHANIVNPGDFATPDLFPDPGNAPLLADITGIFNFGSGALRGTWEEIVAVDPFGISCSGCLDFAFIFNVDQSSANPIATIGFANVFGYTTDMGYVSTGDVAPDLVNRLANIGTFDAVGWGFSGLVGPGQSTDVLVVATNARNFDRSGFTSLNLDPGSVSLGRQSGSIFLLLGPVAAPEPSPVLLLSLGLVGITAFRKRIKA